MKEGKKKHIHSLIHRTQDLRAVSVGIQKKIKIKIGK